MLGDPTLDSQGRLVHTFRQSQLSSLSDCMEMVRRDTLAGPSPDSDATGMGTAMHSAIEASLLELMEYGSAMGPQAMTEMALREFSELALGDGFKWNKYKPWEVDRFLEQFSGVWTAKVLPRLEPIAMEIPFGPLVIHQDDQRVIQLKGTIDYQDANFGLVDWKSDGGGGRKYSTGKGGEAWKLKRWGIQPTVYTWAMHQLEPEMLHPFTYFAFVAGPQVELVELTVTRHAGDWSWLREQCLTYALLIEARLPTWPRNDTHALCSALWCDHWSECKGAHYQPGWPATSAPSTAVTIGGQSRQPRIVGGGDTAPTLGAHI